jgi:hypothetical protein
LKQINCPEFLGEYMFGCPKDFFTNLVKLYDILSGVKICNPRMMVLTDLVGQGVLSILFNRRDVNQRVAVCLIGFESFKRNVAQTIGWDCLGLSARYFLDPPVQYMLIFYRMGLWMSKRHWVGPKAGPSRVGNAYRDLVTQNVAS